MRSGWLVLTVVGGMVLLSASGCVSMDKYRRLEASNRNVMAEKEAIAQELFDIRNGSGSLRTQLQSCERELAAKDALVANLRAENELLDEMRRIAQANLEDTADRLGNVVIAGPKLPPQLDSALKRFADEHPGEVEYDSQRGIVKWKSDLLFALGSDVVKPTSTEALQSFTNVIKSPVAEDFEVIVVGHTDNRPVVRPETKAKHPTNWHLSVHRAISVADALRNYGYQPARIGLMGYGEFRPVAANTSEAGAQQNRRVEVYLVPKGTGVRTTDSGLMHNEAVRLTFAPFARVNG